MRVSICLVEMAAISSCVIPRLRSLVRSAAAPDDCDALVMATDNDRRPVRRGHWVDLRIEDLLGQIIAVGSDSHQYSPDQQYHFAVRSLHQVNGSVAPRPRRLPRLRRSLCRVDPLPHCHLEWPERSRGLVRSEAD